MCGTAGALREEADATSRRPPLRACGQVKTYPDPRLNPESHPQSHPIPNTNANPSPNPDPSLPISILKSH